MATLSALAAVALFACAEAATEVPLITPEALVSSPPTGAVILDVRSPREYAEGHVPGAINLPHDQVSLRIAELGLESDPPIVVYCERGRRAGIAEAVLLEAGFSDVRHLEGDMSGWRAAGRPTEKP
ncbi:MAG: rhodanese-like domain-containing protein [Myxococcota bacterium]